MNSQDLNNIQEAYLTVYSKNLDESSQDYIIPRHVATGVMKGTTQLMKSAVKGGAKLAYGAAKYGTKKFVQHGEQQPEGSKRRKAAELIKRTREATLSPEEKRKREEKKRKEEQAAAREARAAAREARAAARERRAAEREERARQEHERRMGRSTQSESHTPSLKTYQQFNEDIEQRRLELRQKQLERQQAQKEKVAQYQQAQKEKRAQQIAAQQEKIAAQKEREELKKEIERELQTEQSPSMELTPFNIMKAREQAKGGIAHRKHVHGEIAREAGVQQAEKRARIRSIMNR